MISYRKYILWETMYNSNGWSNSASLPTKNLQRQETRSGWREERRPKEDRRDSAYLARAAEAARRKIHGRRRWHCDYAKNLPAELRWTDTLEGASDASHPQLRSYATLARRTSLAAPRYCYLHACSSSVPSVVVVVVVFVIVIQLSYEERRLLSNKLRDIEKHDK